MAHFSPALNLDTKNRGEIGFFKRLKNDPSTENWWVLHSYYLSDHIKQKEGEIDFIVFIPNKGIVVVEVKSSNQIKVKSGDYFYGKSETLGRNPFKQSHDNMWSLINKIKDHNTAPQNFKNMVITHAVVTPKTRFTNTGEYEDWKLCDADLLNKKPLSDFLKEATEKQLEKESKDRMYLSPEACNVTNIRQCLKILRPEVDSLFESFEERITRISKEIEEFTPEQLSVLNSAEKSEQFLITGPAGTGKTTLAIEIASRSVQEEERTLYICYNENLKSNLNNMYGKIGFDIKTFHGLLLDVAQIKVPSGGGDDEFYNNTLLNQAYEKLNTEDLYYDHVIVDEFQDLAREEVLIFIDRLLSGGLRGGKWKFFADFKNQTLYDFSENAENIIQEFIGLPTFTYSLGVNCRNTPSTVGFLEDHIDIEPYYEVRRLDGELPPSRKAYKTMPEQIESLKNNLDNLLKVYDKDEILILSPITNGVVELFNKKYQSLKINNLNYKSNIKNQSGPFFSTIKSFKGLEFHTVIIVDIDIKNFINNKDLDRQLYTAISRALETVSLHVEDDALKLLVDGS